MSAAVSLLVLAWVAIVLLALAVGGLTAQLRTLQIQGSSARPAKRAASPGSLLTPDGPLNGPYIALFTRSACPGCEAVLPAVAAEFATSDRGVPIIVVSDDPSALSFSNGSNIQWIVDPEAATRFGIPAFPWLVAVDDRGKILDDGAVPNPADAIARIYASSMNGKAI